jgi:hypothetical protein
MNSDAGAIVVAFGFLGAMVLAFYWARLLLKPGAASSEWIRLCTVPLDGTLEALTLSLRRRKIEFDLSRIEPNTSIDSRDTEEKVHVHVMKSDHAAALAMLERIYPGIERPTGGDVSSTLHFTSTSEHPSKT